MVTEEKANIDWANVGFGYHKTDKTGRKIGISG